MNPDQRHSSRINCSYLQLRYLYVLKSKILQRGELYYYVDCSLQVLFPFSTCLLNLSNTNPEHWGQILKLFTPGTLQARFWAVSLRLQRDTISARCRSLTANHNWETVTKREVIWEGLTTQFSRSSPERTAACSRHTHSCRMRNAGFPVSMKTINFIQIFWILFHQIWFFP